jgi:exonuclease V gamma subunit
MFSIHSPLLQPGFLAFHSNRSEKLAEVVISWLRRHPVGPLEEEIILVQSNGMAEWVKMEMARMGGLPVRFARKPATSTKSYTGRVVLVGIASGFRSVG